MPRIKTTRTVRVALWALRIYLLVLLSLIAIKFARVFSGSQNPTGPSARTAATTTNQPTTKTRP
jgi:hypothetical protein